MVAVGDKIMIFGGRGTRQRFNDLYILDAKVKPLILQLTQILVYFELGCSQIWCIVMITAIVDKQLS